MALNRIAPPVFSLLIAASCAEGGGRDSASSGLSGGIGPGLTSASASAAEGTSTATEGGESEGATAGESTPGSETDAATTSSGATDPTSATEPGEDTGADATTATGDASDGTTASTSGVDSGGQATDAEPKFDLGDDVPMPEPDVPDEGSCVNVDLLFVIDNSASMRDEQINLIASVPGFIEEMQQQLVAAESLHIGVVSTDAYEFNQPPCNDVFGALVTQTGGNDSSDAICGPYVEGKRYMTEDDDLGQRFACAALVGTDGDGDERPVDAALYALGPGLAAPGACNEGFVRDDALLVVVLITDEEEEGSVGEPPQWFNTLVDLKGGAETNIVVLSLIGTADPVCPDAYEIGHRLIQFTELFTYGSVGQICAPSYQMFFHQAIAGIVEACDHFIPPG